MVSGGDKDQKGKSDTFFQANHLEHLGIPTKKVVTVGFLVSLLFGTIWVVRSIISNYESFKSAIDEQIPKHPTVIQMKHDINKLQDKSDEIEGNVNWILRKDMEPKTRRK